MLACTVECWSSGQREIESKTLLQCFVTMHVVYRRRQQELEELHEEIEYQLRPLLEKSGQQLPF